MPFEVDPSFKKAGKASRSRSSKRRAIRVALLSGGAVVGVAALVGLILWFVLRDPVDPGQTQVTDGGDQIQPIGDDPVVTAGRDGEEDFFVQTAASAESGVTAASARDINRRDDPLVLTFEQSSGEETVTTLSGPDEFSFSRVGGLAEDRLTVVSDVLVVEEQRLVTALPSSQEDFAFFQAARSQALADPVGALPAGEDAEAGEVVVIEDGEGSWGETIDGSEGGDEAVYVETTIENTTSLVVILPEERRQEIYSDIVVVVQTERSLVDVLVSNGFSEEEAEWSITGLVRSGTEAIDEAGLRALPPGSIVAIRTRMTRDGSTIISQMTLYTSEGWLESFARTGLRRFETAADPWFGEDLLLRSASIQQATQAQQDIRLLDALYSAGIRNGLSTSVVGELITVMSQLYDLDGFAAVGDKVTIVSATNPGPRGQGAGQVLYVGITSGSGEMTCYIVELEESGSYGCYDFTRAGTAQGGLGNGLVTPVAGTMTSGFGPRQHPVLGQVRVHGGVDWAAPQGTPIQAAMAGRISRRAFSESYGNVIYIDHGNGIETRYAHMVRFAEPELGDQVQAGQLIGYVGTTGRSTGPHLHFELRIGGQAVDPLTWRGGGGSGGSASAAVEALVNQIIQVESGGDATAANPRSSARGLGQFIRSTWLRMMRDYRPDLVAALNGDEEAILNLRFDPALSREMVRNLARENEAFLRANGRTITAGNLYLAHFLGPAGAVQALRADSNKTVLEEMGSAVVNANPFLRGKTVGWMINWAARKMEGAGSGSSAGSAPVVVEVPAEVRQYRERVDAVLAMMDPEEEN